MASTRGEFSTFRWLCTIIGFMFYLGDIGSDLLLTMQYFRAGHLTWAALTLVFILSGSLCIQIFSYAWFNDDKRDKEEDSLSTGHLIGIHVLQIGIITRYLDLIKRSFKALWFNQVQSRLFDFATDLSMLRLFETFLESVPQLVLQLYIILEHNHRSTLQYISMAVSFLNIAWSTVDYRRCLRHSLPHINEMPCGIPTVVYLLYKVLTITPRILSLTLFIMLSTFSTLAIAFMWLLGTFWACLEKTDFCTSRVLECVYRATVGVILIFTFFNIKGENTKVPMTTYYIFSVSQNLAAPILLCLFKPESEETDYFLPIILFILMSNSLGLGFLGIYYSHLHPRKVADEIDGMERNEQKTEKTRLNNFLKI